jgi:cytosine/adenosine deaminase-related metal-dependent hydrolase
MPTLLLKHAGVLVTMDGMRREIVDGALLARDGVIAEVGPTAELPATADEVLDLSGHVVVPGLVNTHHHLCQNLTRAVPAASDATLFNWLKALYPVWARVGPEHIRLSATVGLAELLLSGCTTTSDHLYLFPNGARLDDEIEAAREIGVRFHATRGAMSIGESAGGLPPDSLVEREDAILADCERAVARHHDPRRHAMTRVAIAPCSPFSVSRELMRDAALLARRLGVGLHTHLAENAEDVAYSLERFGMRPGDYAESLGWTGPDVWHAHCVALDGREIGLFARSGTGVAHCPCSNMRLGSGIAPIAAMLAAGVKVGLGVDGTASNDGASLIGEARQAMLLQRVAHGAEAMPARRALELATLGGAAVLGRDDIGRLGAGMACDVAAFRTDTIAMAGAWDPVAALVLSGPHQAAAVVVDGRIVVREGRITTIELERVLARHRRLARALANGEV